MALYEDSEKFWNNENRCFAGGKVEFRAMRGGREMRK